MHHQALPLVTPLASCLIELCRSARAVHNTHEACSRSHVSCLGCMMLQGLALNSHLWGLSEASQNHTERRKHHKKLPGLSEAAWPCPSCPEHPWPSPAAWACHLPSSCPAACPWEQAPCLQKMHTPRHQCYIIATCVLRTPQHCSAWLQPCNLPSLQKAWQQAG